MMNDKVTKILATVFFVAVAIVSLLVAIKQGSNNNDNGSTRSHSEFTGALSNLNPLEQAIIEALRGINVHDSLMESTFEIHEEIKVLNIEVPRGKPMEEIIKVIQQAYGRTSYELDDSHYSSSNDKASMFFISSRRNREDIRVNLSRSRSAVFPNNSSLILIVSGLDTVDADTRLRFLMYDKIISYQIPIWNEQIVEFDSLLTRYNAPMVVSLPLQSESQTRSTSYTIRIDDQPRTVDGKISELMRIAPSTVAIASDGGTLLLENSASEHFFDELKRRNILFFDRRPGNVSSRARQSAQNEDAHYIRSNGNLDAESVEAITSALRNASQRAQLQREIIIWAEASAELIQALEDCKPYFESTGVTLNGVTTLIN